MNYGALRLIITAVFLEMINKPKQLLYLGFIARVRLEEMEQARTNVEPMLGELTQGFRVLADLERVQAIDTNCTSEIGRFMDMCDQRGVGMIVRVIPDPTKDIGLNIMSRFHYRISHPRMVTCKSILEAAELLRL